MAIPVPIEVASGTGDVQGVAARDDLVLDGFSVSETASSASTAEVVLRHGITDTSPLLTSHINLAADGYGMFFVGGINCPNGIFIERVSGETELVLYVKYI